MSVNDDQPSATQVSDCVFMKLPKCKLQDVTKRMDLQICIACIAGRTERHIYDIKEILAKSAQRSARG